MSVTVTEFIPSIKLSPPNILLSSSSTSLSIILSPAPELFHSFIVLSSMLDKSACLLVFKS